MLATVLAGVPVYRCHRQGPGDLRYRNDSKDPFSWLPSYLDFQQVQEGMRLLVSA